MNVIGTQEFCLCRQPVIHGTNQCANHCKTYFANYGKQFWTIKVKGFRLYLNTEYYISRIKMTSMQDESWHFHVNIPFPQRYVHNGFLSVFGKAFANFITSKVTTVKIKNIDVPLRIVSYNLNYWFNEPRIDFVVLSLNFEVTTKSYNAYYVNDMNFGLELELSNLDKATPWIEKL